jgi:hypothetical protein
MFPRYWKPLTFPTRRTRKKPTRLTAAKLKC